MKATSIQVPNKSGTFKKFRSMEANGVAEWRASEDTPKGTRSSKPKKQTPDQIMERCDEAIGSSFPDGDPIDHLLSYMRINKVEMDDIDRVYNKAYKIKTGFYGYIAQLWEEHARSAIADTRRISAGSRDQNNPYYYIEKGEVVQRSNPWRHS